MTQAQASTLKDNITKGNGNAFSKAHVAEITTPDNASDTSIAKALLTKSASKRFGKVDVSKGIGFKPKANKIITTDKKADVKPTTSKKTEQPKAGVILTILELIQKSGKQGITKQEIVDQLTKLFPDRDPIGMSKTVGVQIPTRMNRERKIEIINNDGHYMIK